MRRKQWVVMIAALAFGCQGPGGGPGADGSHGQDGEDGAPGLACWDLDEDGEADPDEDTNGDGTVDVLDCQGGEDDEEPRPFLGDLEIDDPVVASAFCDDYDRIYGSLTITHQYTAEDMTDLACLVEIRGRLSAYDPAVDAFALPALVSVGSADLMGNPINLPSLVEARGPLRAFLPEGARLAAERLEVVQGDLGVERGAGFVLPALREVQGHLKLSGQSVAVLDDLGSLESIGGDLGIVGFESLSDVSALEALGEIGGNVYVRGCPTLSEAHVREVLQDTTIGGRFEFRDTAP